MGNYQNAIIEEGLVTVLPIDTIALYLTGVSNPAAVVVGDEISGDTSGAAAIVAAVSDVEANTMTVYLKTVTGTFEADELVAIGTDIVAASGSVVIVDYLKAILTAATQTLTLTGAIVPGSHAESVVTSDTTNVAEDETITIGATVYRFRDTLAQAYDVQIGASAAATLDNLKAAINASGTPGTEYFAGTEAHPDVVATDNADTTQKIVTRIPGTASNAAATTTTASHLSWADTTLGGGTGASNPGVAPETVTIGGRAYSFVDVLSETNAPAAAVADQVLFGADSAAALDNLKSAINASAGVGTTYSTGTVAHATVNATTNSDTEQTIAADTAGSAGNAITTTSVLANGSWGAATLAGGYDNLTITVKGVALVQGTDFTAETSNDVTATNLEVAIEAITGINSTVAAATVTVNADAEGDIGNSYTLVTSSAAAATVSGATLSGGAEEVEGTIDTVDTTAPAQIIDCSGAQKLELINFDANDDCWLSLANDEPTAAESTGSERLVHAAGWRTFSPVPKRVRIVSATTKFPTVLYRLYK